MDPDPNGGPAIDLLFSPPLRLACVPPSAPTGGKPKDGPFGGEGDPWPIPGAPVSFPFGKGRRRKEDPPG
eukprot:scaffold1800_cov332-Pavlova_lutheri.AAC.1